MQVNYWSWTSYWCHIYWFVTKRYNLANYL